MAQDLFPADSWTDGVEQPDVIVNDNARRLEVLSLPALSFEATEPGSPAAGDLHVLSAAWGTGVEHDLAYYFDDAWTFWTPFEGQLKDVGGVSYRFDAGAWGVYSPGVAASIAIQYVADLGSTADSDPGPGLLKWNHATQASATQLYLDDDTSDGVSLTALWAALDAGGFIYLQHATDQDTWQIWNVTAVTDATGYAKLTVSLVANGGGFADADPMLVTIDQGFASTPLADGDYGDVTVSSSGTVITIDNLAVSTGKIAAGAVTLAKQADVATATVFYRKTAGTGSPEVQTLATLKTDLGLTGTNSGDQTSIVGISGTIAQFNTACSDADFATGGGTVTGASSGTNTGDQTSIVGITGTKAQFDTACSDGNFAYQSDLTTYDTRGTHDVFVHPNAMSLPSVGATAARGQVATSSGQPDIISLDFDATTQEYALFGLVPPKKWNGGTVTFIAHWSHAATATNFGVAWGLQAGATSNDDAIGTAYGTGGVVTDTGGTTDDLYTTSESSAVTIGSSPAKGDMVFFRVFRSTANGSDTMAIDARLMGLTVRFTTDASTDA